MTKTSSQKKVLILAYDFPPYVSVGGLRPYSWYKYFGEFGIYPVVVTRQWENKYGNHLDYIAPSETNQTIIEQTEQGTIIRTPYKPNLANKILLKYGENKFKLIRRLITAFYELFQFIFFVGPKVQLYYVAKEYLKTNKVDVIIATGEPFVLFKYSSTLSKKFNIPWIADYRDPWTQNKKRKKFLIINRIQSFYEHKFLNNAKLLFLTTANEFFKYKISEKIKNKNIYVIENGFNPDISEKQSLISRDSKILNIAIVGTIYDYHPLKEFLRGVNSFLKDNSRAKLNINFFGTNKDFTIKNLIKNKFKLLDQKVFFYKKIDNTKLAEYLSKQNILILFNYYAIIGTKIYDYLAAKRCILLCFTGDNIVPHHKIPYSEDFAKGINYRVQEDLIKKTNSGFAVKDPEELSQLLDRIYLEFQNKGYVECNSENIEKYSRKIRAEEFCKIINKLI